jgi:hypothetical protein
MAVTPATGGGVEDTARQPSHGHSPPR